MKGLIIKDVLTLLKQAKIFLLFIVIFSLMPGYNMASFAIVYAMILPITALAYDERCKWDQLAAMMPYSTAQLVISKYVLGIICMLVAAAISYVATLAQSAFNLQDTSSWQEYVTILAGSVAAGMLMQLLMLPVLFKVGTEKGRLLLMAMLVLISLGAMGLSSILDINSLISNINMTMVAVVAGIAIIALYGASIMLSIRLYKNRVA